MELPTNSQLFSRLLYRFPGLHCARWCRGRDTGRDIQGKVRPVVSIQGHRARGPCHFERRNPHQAKMRSKASVYLRLWVSVPRKE